jgi:hypothetical protein
VQCQEAVAHALAYTALYNSPNQEILGDYHEKGCFRFGHDDDPVLRNLQLDVVLPERHDGALHNPQLRLQRDPEDNRVVEREGIRMVATRRPLGGRIQSPPPPYNSGEEHHDLQQRASRESSPNVDDWICLFEDRHRSPSTTRRSQLRPEGTRTPDEDAAANAPYSSANRQLKQAQEMLVAQGREAAEKLENVHTYYEKKLQQASTSTDRPSSPDA